MSSQRIAQFHCGVIATMWILNAALSKTLQIERLNVPDEKLTRKLNKKIKWKK